MLPSPEGSILACDLLLCCENEVRVSCEWAVLLVSGGCELYPSTYPPPTLTTINSTLHERHNSSQQGGLVPSNGSGAERKLSNPLDPEGAPTSEVPPSSGNSSSCYSGGGTSTTGGAFEVTSPASITLFPCVSTRQESRGWSFFGTALVAHVTMAYLSQQKFVSIPMHTVKNINVCSTVA